MVMSVIFIVMDKRSITNLMYAYEQIPAVRHYTVGLNTKT